MEQRQPAGAGRGHRRAYRNIETYIGYCVEFFISWYKATSRRPQATGEPIEGVQGGGVVVLYKGRKQRHPAKSL